MAHRDKCLSDVSCLKNIYLDRLSDDLFELENFRVTKLFNFQTQNEEYFLVRDDFGGAYNMEMYVSHISPSKLEKISWKLPEFDEQEKTCGLSILLFDAIKVSDAGFSIGMALNFSQNSEVSMAITLTPLGQLPQFHNLS